MAQMSERFNFDDFDQQIQDALDENEQAMADFDRVFGRYPGQIGGVALSTSSLDAEPTQSD